MMQLVLSICKLKFARYFYFRKIDMFFATLKTRYDMNSRCLATLVSSQDKKHSKTKQTYIDRYNKGVRKKLQKHISEEDLNKIGKKFEELEQSGLTGRELEVATAKAMKEVYNVVPKTFAQKLDGFRYINMLLSGKSRIKDFSTVQTLSLKAGTSTSST